jgi:hypothetical protein
MKTTKFSVFYYNDGEVTRINFEMPRGTADDLVITVGAGLLFLHDCCPGEDWCVVETAADGIVSKTQGRILPNNQNGRIMHHYYGWDDKFLTADSEPYVIDHV